MTRAFDASGVRAGGGAGFSSWHALDEQLGWRQTLVVFAVINLAVCLPLHWFGLARRGWEDAP